MKKLLQMKFMLLLCALIVGSGTMWAGDVLTLDCATPAPTGSTSTALSSTSDVATFLNSAAGLSSAENKITCSNKTGDIYKGKGSGGGNIPQQCLKVGKASGGGSFTFTIPNNYDEIDEVKMTCYGWKTSSSISVNGGTAQTFTTAQAVTTKTFELSSSSRTIAIAVTSSAVCITEIVLKKSGGSTTFKVTYNGNDATSGNVPVDNNEYAANAEVTVLGNTGDLAKTGCAFDGWNTQANGGGTNYDADDTFTISANTTLYAKWTPYTITAQSNNESYGTVTLSGNEITGSPNSGYRYANPAYTVAPENSATVVQDGNTFTVTPTANTTITINFEAIPTHTATFSVNGTTTTTDFQEGAAITFPANPADIEGKSFVGWTTAAIEGTTDTAPELVTSATMGNADITYYAVFANAEGDSETKLDVLTSSVTGNTTSSYANFSNKSVSGGSNAVYAGNCAGSNSYIQLRTSSNTGIVSTTSGGKAKKVTVSWSSTSDRALQVYGSNTAYTGLSDIFDDNKKGTLLGTLTYGSTTELSITGNYAYIGIKPDSSKSGASQLSNITIDWETSSITYSGYCTTVAADTREEAGLSFAESTATVEWYVADQYTGQNLTNPNNVSPITWTSSNEEVATVENGTVTVLALGETTIKAKFEGNDDYKPGEASYTLTVVDNRQTATVTWKDADGNNITELNVEKGDFIQGITLSCNVEGFTFTEKHLQHLWGTNEKHDNYIGLQPAGYIFTPNAVWTAALGITTITATFPGNETHKPASATLTVTVTGGTATAPYTVAEARAAIDAGTGTNDVYAKGIVSEIVTALNNSGQITYNISEDGTTTSDQLQVYKGKSYDGENFVSEDEIQVGDVVIIHGTLKNYKGTYEFDANNQLYFNQPKLTVDDEDKTVTVNAAGTITSHEQQTIKINYRNFTTAPSANNVSVVFCEENGTLKAEGYDWINSITYNGGDDGYFTMNCSFAENTGDTRTGYAEVAVTVGSTIYYSDIITITQSAPATSHTATFYVNGTQISPVEIETGSAIDFPEVSDIDGMTFLGWTDNEISGTQASANYVTEATMGDGDVTYYAVFALLVPGTSTTYTDELTHDLIGVTGTSYSNWSGITDNSGAVYAGNSAGGNTAIQLRSNSNSGIVTTTSGGKLKKVTVEWNGNTANDRTLDIYGKNTAYSSAEDLYNNTSQGTSIGSIAKNGTTYELSVNGDYEYVGLRSHSGAMYLDKITIEWETGTPDTYSDYCTTIPAMLTVTIAEACTDGSKYYGTYSSSSAFKVPANVTVSEIGIDAEGKMVVSNYDSGDIVPANTGVMVSATTFGEHKLIISSEEGTSVPGAENRLRPTGDNGLTATEMNSAVSETCKFYRLTMHNSTTIGFWWGADGGQSFDIAANKAYLAVPASVAGARNGFAFGDDATGISNVNVNENVNGSVFDLQGRKVNKPGKGLYIVNGKKVVIK